jgi:hypothetical protein
MPYGFAERVQISPILSNFRRGSASGKSTDAEFGGFAISPWIGRNSWQRRTAMETQVSDKFTYNNGRKYNLWK